MINYVKGDLLESRCDYICHQVNCYGVMGSGIAKQIREKWPDVYADYKKYCDDVIFKLGTVLVSDLEDGRSVINMFSQHEYGYDGRRYTSYDAFEECLQWIKKNIPYGMSIGFPKGIGCGLGGGNWLIISAMIEAVLGKSYDIYIYEFTPKEVKHV